MKRTLVVSLRLPVELAASILTEYPPPISPATPIPRISLSILNALEVHAAEHCLPRQAPKVAWQQLANTGVSPMQCYQALGIQPPPTTYPQTVGEALDPASLSAITTAIDNP